MKKINILLATLFLTSLTIGCNDEDEAEVFQNREISGIGITIDGEGALQGEPNNPDDLESSTVNFIAHKLDLNIIENSVEDASLVESFEVIKQLNGGEEIIVATATSLPINISYSSVSDFLEGTSLSEGDLRIGDEFSFIVKIHQTNGKTNYVSTPSFSLTVNCFADLSGTYTVTNSICGTGKYGTIPSVEITENPDGTWELETVDGGLLQYCSTNATLVNGGTISLVCGTVSGTSAFCGSNGIGCITGGSWDQEAGVLTLELNDTFFGYGDYTATYTRQ